MFWGHEDANSTEFRPKHRIPGDRPDAGTARHHRYGRYDAVGVIPVCTPTGTKAAKAYGEKQVRNAHRHRWEFIITITGKNSKHSWDCFSRASHGMECWWRFRKSWISLHGRQPIPTRSSFPDPSGRIRCSWDWIKQRKKKVEEGPRNP